MNKLALILSLFSLLTYAQYECDWNLVSSGGTSMSVGNLSAQVSVSQTAVGIIQSTNQVGQIGFWVIDTALVGMKEISTQKLPLKTELLPIRPNPFSKNTLISYSLSEETNVSIIIYNTCGELAKHLSFSKMKPGIYSFTFSGEKLKRGVYFLNFSTGGYKAVRKIILMR
ncbi:MAG: T9SS type A sorting domain-containing protein [candidate division WOR-3 bacterium]